MQQPVIQLGQNHTGGGWISRAVKLRMPMLDHLTTEMGTCVQWALGKNRYKLYIRHQN